MRRLAMMTTFAVASAACAASSAGDDAATGDGATSPATTASSAPFGDSEDRGDDAEAASSDADVSSRPAVESAPSPNERQSAPTAPAPTSPPDPDPPVSTVADVEADTAPTGSAETEDPEPSFDLGPSVELDVDVARFPVDDAGQGGTDAASGEPGTVEPGSAPAPTGWAAFDASLESALLRPENTSAAVAVMIGGDLVHTAAFGVRDPARGDPAQPTDRWRIASISKPITAIAALDLVEDGLIGLDEPVGQRIADHVGAGPVSAAARSLTLRRLLSHTSGFGRYYGTFFQLGAADCADAARQGLARASGGGGYAYSNMNYCLAGMLVEAVTGESLERATYASVLTPLGISGMRLAPTVDPGPGEAQHRTTPGRAYMETLGGAGSWIASPIDLVTIIDSLDHSTSGFKPLEPPTVFQMLTPQGGAPGQRGYGLGIISYGAGRFGHTGTIEATHAMALNRGDGVVWAVTVAGDWPADSERLEALVDAAFVAGGFVAG